MAPWKQANLKRWVPKPQATLLAPQPVHDSEGGTVSDEGFVERAYREWCAATGATPTPLPAPAPLPWSGRGPLGGAEDPRRSEFNPDWALVAGEWAHAPLPVTADDAPVPVEYAFIEEEKAYWRSEDARASTKAHRDRFEAEDYAAAELAKALTEIEDEDRLAAEEAASREPDVIDFYAASREPVQLRRELAEMVDAYLGAEAQNDARALAAERAELDARWAEADRAARASVASRKRGPTT